MATVSSTSLFKKTFTSFRSKNLSTVLSTCSSPAATTIGRSRRWVNLKAEQGDSKKLPVVWTSYLTGFETGSKAINRTLAVEAVNQSFTQSPYLTNK